jgi:Domain of unknown function (DUF1731)
MRAFVTGATRFRRPGADSSAPTRRACRGRVGAIAGARSGSGDDRYRGPVNGVAPEQTTSRSFARALGRALHRPAILPLPALALKVIFGEAATVLLASQRVDPWVLREHQFAFDFPTLDSALEDIVGGTAVAISPAQSRPEGAGEARYELRARTVIDAPPDQTFALFSKAANLGVITPALQDSRRGRGLVPTSLRSSRPCWFRTTVLCGAPGLAARDRSPGRPDPRSRSV